MLESICSVPLLRFSSAETPIIGMLAQHRISSIVTIFTRCLKIYFSLFSPFFLYMSLLSLSYPQPYSLQCSFQYCLHFCDGLVLFSSSYLIYISSLHPHLFPEFLHLCFIKLHNRLYCFIIIGNIFHLGNQYSLMNKNTDAGEILCIVTIFTGSVATFFPHIFW